MQYLGNTETGEVCASSNWEKLFPGTTRSEALYHELAVEITGKQKGEFKAILRKKNLETGKYEFKAFTSRECKKALEYKKQGWEMRKDYPYKTTYDEYSFAGQIKNQKPESASKKYEKKDIKEDE